MTLLIHVRRVIFFNITVFKKVLKNFRKVSIG